jgi:putative transposase
VPEARNVLDDVTKECLAAVPDTSLSGKRVVREMQALIGRRGRPGSIVSDNVCWEMNAA